MGYYLIPDLPEIDCLHESSELSRDRSEVITGVLRQNPIEGCPLFRLGGVEGRIIVANLEFVESAFRREVMGMRMEEFIVQ